MSLASWTIRSVLRQTRAVRRNPAAALLLLGILIELSYAAWREHALIHLFAYLAAVWTGCLVTDVVTGMFSLPGGAFPIAHSPVVESLLVVTSTLLGFSGLALRFSFRWAQLLGLSKLLAVSLLLGFTFPVVLLLVFVFLLGYRPFQLGINLRFWYLPALINILFGVVTLSVAPQLSHWKEYFRKEGVLRGLCTGIVAAGLSEEFLRMLLQTRLGRMFASEGLGVTVAAIVWAVMHVPILHDESPMTPISILLIGSLHIVPIGLLWGYITLRTKSILPAAVAHGLN